MGLKTGMEDSHGKGGLPWVFIICDIGFIKAHAHGNKRDYGMERRMKVRQAEIFSRGCLVGVVGSVFMQLRL